MVELATADDSTVIRTGQGLHPGGVPARVTDVFHLSQPLYHLVFGTKNRIPSIDLPWRSGLHEHMGGTVRGLDGFSEGMGGTVDHVHSLVALKSNHCLADVMREMKKASSAWVHKEIGLRSFAWPEGYTAFTVSATGRDAVRKYISNQEEHHRLKSFREGVVELLEKAGVEYDPGYLD